MRKLGFLTLAALLFTFSVTAQTISGVINEYRKVVEYNSSGQGWVRITPDTAPYAVGDTVLLIQMKGATVDRSNDAGYGDVTDLGEAGNYEKNEICRIDGDTVFFRFEMVNEYDPAGAVQLVTVPKYANVTIDGTLSAAPWDGDVGGVLIFEAAGDVVLNGDIDVSGQGFRGGDVGGLEFQYGKLGGSTCNGHPIGGSDICNNNIYFNCVPTDYFLDDDKSAAEYLLGAYKGEGITDFYFDGEELGMGKLATGGGGGNSHNAGGAGGGNYGAGGNGGKGWSTLCGAGIENGGKGGLGIASSVTGKVFLGGGGGGGHQNFQVSATPGKNGGGIVIISAGFIIVNGNRSIDASGLSQDIRSDAGDQDGDGAGGGGAGGSIILDVANYLINAGGALDLAANGGKGGDLINNECLGPGGGGGGGVIYSSAALDPSITTDVTGGDNGINYRNGVPTDQCDPAHFATPGEDGLVQDGQSIPMGSIDVCTPCVAPNADITPSTTQIVCVGESTVFTALHPGLDDADASYQWLRNGGAIPSQTNKTYTATLPGNYSVEVTDQTQPNNPACPSVSPEVSFSIISQPTISVFGEQVFCPGDSAQLTAFTGIGVDIQWYDGSGEIVGATDSVYYAKASGDYYAIAGAGTCTTTSNTITVNEAVVPDPNITPSTTDPVCEGDEVVLTSSVNDLTFTYVWYRDGVAVFGGTGETTYSATVSGDYHVQVTDPNAFSCPGYSDTITVQVINASSVNVTGEGVYCEGEIEVALVGASGGVIEWYKDDMLLPDDTETITVTETGKYKAIVDFNGCTSSDSAQVIVSPNPTAGAMANGPTEFCLGDSVQLEATPNGTGEYDYFWLKDGNIFSGDSVITTQLAGVYEAIVLNEQGCRDTSDAITVTVLPLPNATISGGGILCEGGSVELSTSTASTYQWYRDDVLIPNADQQIYSATEAGLYKVLLSNGTCADTSGEVEVLVEPTPQVTITGPTAGCSNDDVLLTAEVIPADDANSPAYFYNWFLNGNSTGNVGFGKNTYDVKVGGDYTVVVKIASCEGTSPAYPVTIDQAPTVAILPGDQTICVGDSVALVALGGTTYEWFIDNATTGITNDTIYAKTAGVYKVEVANGSCVSEAEVTVTVENSVTVNINAFPSAVECKLDNIMLTATSNISNAEYYWYEGSSLTPFEQGNEVFVENTATYRVEAIAGDNANCTNDASLAVQVENIDPLINETGICGDNDAVLNGGTYPGATYEWYKTDAIDNYGGTLEGNAENFSTNIEGFYWLRVEKGACIDSSNIVSVEISPVPEVEAVEVDTVCATSGIQLVALASGGTAPLSYAWGPAEFLNDSTSAEPLANNLIEDVTFKVWVIDAKNCVDSATVAIDADKERFIIPNIFTPNGDGVNEYFVIKGVVKGGKLRIVNRWGDTVFYVNKYQNDWDGEELNDGTYFYNYISPCDEKEYKGWVQILR